MYGAIGELSVVLQQHNYLFETIQIEKVVSSQFQVYISSQYGIRCLKGVKINSFFLSFPNEGSVRRLCCVPYYLAALFYMYSTKCGQV